MSSEAQTSYHGIAARLDRIPITGMHRKVLWLLAGITFCDSVDWVLVARLAQCSSQPTMPLAISG